MRLVSAPRAPGRSLDELLGPPEVRPGELREALALPVPTTFRESVEGRVPIALAAALVIERELALTVGAVADRQPLIDRCADRAAITGPLSAASSAYARRLLGFLHSRQHNGTDDSPITIPVRLAERLRATGYTPQLDPATLMPALRWELAAVVAGQTMTEWALLLTLGGWSYSAATERQSGASKTAS